MSNQQQSPAWTRLIRFIAVEDGLTYSGEPILAQTADVGQAFAAGSPPLQARILARDDPLDTSLRLLSTIKTVKKLLPPLDPKTQLGEIRCLGANFVQPGQDVKEAKSVEKRPKLPIVFYKPASCVVGYGDEIRLPIEAAGQTDWEVELVVVIGKTCKNVKRENAMDYILGYTLSNDVSARTRMFAVPQWGLGKSFDRLVFSVFLPRNRVNSISPLSSLQSHSGGSIDLAIFSLHLAGPCLISCASQLVYDPDSVQLKTHVNGKKMQDGNTREMLFGVCETIEWLSQGTTLHPGSIISMGTPPGEGFKMKPPIFFKHGDLCTVSGSHGLGSLTNPVVEEGKLSSTGGEKSRL